MFNHYKNISKLKSVSVKILCYKFSYVCVHTFKIWMPVPISYLFLVSKKINVKQYSPNVRVQVLSTHNCCVFNTILVCVLCVKLAWMKIVCPAHIVIYESCWLSKVTIGNYYCLFVCLFLIEMWFVIST